MNLDEELEAAGVTPGRRWTAQRKLALTVALQRNPDRTVEVMERFNISADEMVEWTKALERGGGPGRPAIDAFKATNVPPRLRPLTGRRAR